MAIIELVADDFCDDGKCVKVANVVRAIARRFLADGSPNRFQAERDAWPWVHTGIVMDKLHSLDQTNRELLSVDNYGGGMVLFDELVEWGKWCHRFDFVKQAAPAAHAAKGEAGADATSARLTVATQQNDAILNWLKESQHDPLKLPVPPSGKAGVKKLCRDALCGNSKQLFSSISVFNTAWDRLRANDEIRDE